MAQADDSRDGTASRLLLDIKALSLLYPSDSGLRGVLEKSFVDYSDDDVRRLTDIIRPGRRESRVGGVLVASSEIVFASFLAILGIGSFVPNMIGVESPNSSSATSPIGSPRHSGRGRSRPRPQSLTSRSR